MFKPSFVNSNQVGEHALIPSKDKSDSTWVTTWQRCIPIESQAENGWMSYIYKHAAAYLLFLSSWLHHLCKVNLHLEICLRALCLILGARGHHTDGECGQKTQTQPWAPHPVMQHLLEVSLQKSQLSQEMAWGLHTTTQWLLALWKTTTPIAVTLLSVV